MNWGESVKEHWRVLLGLFIAFVALIWFYPSYDHLLAVFYDAEAVRLFIESFGVFAPLVLISLQVFQVLLAPIPGQIIGVASGYAFGTFWGTIYTMIGVALGSIIAIMGAKLYGRPVVERFVSEEQLARFDELTETYGFTPFFLLFLLPGFPDDTVCFIAGLTRLDARKMIIYAIIGRLPGMFALNLTGDSVALADLDMTIMLVFIIAVVSFLSIHQRERILAYAKTRRKQKPDN